MPPKDTSLKELRHLLEYKLLESALTLEHAELLGMQVMQGAEAQFQLEVPLAVGGVQIPYFNVDGTQSEFWRFRYLEPTLTGFEKLTGKKALRYVQKTGSLNQLYLPPLVDWDSVSGDVTQSVVITEGELKSACACAHGIPTIGLGGVWCFRSAANSLSMLPQFSEFVWEGRLVNICYDSDAATNDHVMQAENQLARELTKLGARVFITRLVSTVPGKKMGLDDCIAVEGVSAFAEAASRATPWGPSEELFKLNEEVLYVSNPSMVIKLDNMQIMTPKVFVHEVFKNRHYTEQVPAARGTTRTVTKFTAEEWMKWKYRATVNKITYHPGADRIVDDNLNTWTGWGCMPVDGPMEPWHMLMDYMFFNSPEAERQWFEQWLAYPLQNPGVKMTSAVIFWGTQHGTGKSLIGYTMGAIYGNNFRKIKNADLTAGFNNWAKDKQFILGEEITGGDRRADANTVKDMITQLQMSINIKFQPEYTLPDCINYYFTSNHPDAFFLEDTDRRFFVHEVNKPPLPDAFYKQYDAWLHGRGPQSLFDYLLKVDLEGFNPQASAPMTDSKRDMIDSGKSDISSWVAQLKVNPEAALRVGDVSVGYKLFTAAELHAVYDQHHTGKTTVNGMARELSRANMPRVYGGRSLQTNNGTQRLWLVRDISGHENMTGPELAALYHAERGVSCKRTIKY